MKFNKKANCIRKVANFSYQSNKDKIDKNNFDLNSFKKKLDIISPKMIKLLENIEKLDKEDMRKHNKLFKHVIYTDIKESNSGAKMIAAGLLTEGYENVYGKELKIKENILNNRSNKKFALLCSVQIYNKPFSIKLKKNILEKFNARPENINGNKIRFIIIDSGYKEGIDLFDVKYLHIFEPLITKSEEKQVIGRSTRYCGQKGLEFKPNIGWELNIYKYDLLLENSNKTAHNKFIESSGINIDKLKLANELEKTSIYGSVDFDLTKNIHKYKKEGGGIKGKQKRGLNINLERAPRRILNFVNMRKYIIDNFSKYKWNNDITLKNGCTNENKIIKEKLKNLSLGGKYEFKKFINKNKRKLIKYSLPTPNKNLPPSLPIEVKDERLISFTQTQKFVSNYFNYKSAYNGLLLWHSVGTGKTCTAIATATRGFEQHNYTILWVTRHTLKSEIWKNMFEKVCSVVLRRKILNGENIPKKIKSNYKKYISDNWILPISYKQFSNLLKEKNKYYKILKKINGNEDPLRKTLVIIDEAHKLFNNDIVAAERPNVEIMKNKIKRSYKISGKDSVKLLLLTATPYTDDPMQLIKLINLMKRENEEISEDYEEFSKKYLNNGKFTENGKRKYLDEISGYISYLNREQDRRNFAFPVINNLTANLSLPNKEITEIKKNIEKKQDEVEEFNNNLKVIKNLTKEEKNNIKDGLKKRMEYIKNLKKKLKIEVEKDNSQLTNLNKCKI